MQTTKYKPYLKVGTRGVLSEADASTNRYYRLRLDGITQVAEVMAHYLTSGFKTVIVRPPQLQPILPSEMPQQWLRHSGLVLTQVGFPWVEASTPTQQSASNLKEEGCRSRPEG